MLSNVFAIALYFSAALVAAREVNQDDIPEPCTYEYSCQNVVSQATNCGTAATTNGDVFSNHYWVDCACQVDHSVLDSCASCVAQYQEGGDIAMLQDVCENQH